MNITPDTLAAFKETGMFRVKSDEKARERFEEGCESDFPEDMTDTPENRDLLFARLLEYREADKADKRAKAAAREARKAEKEAKEAAKPVADGFKSLAEKIETRQPGRYVLTAAQNNTNVDKAAFAALRNFCERNGATLLIARLTYNKSAFQQPGVDADDLWYDPAVVPYLVRGQLDLGGYHFLADANVIPTATWPTSGFDGNTPAGIGAIIPASKIELRVSAAGKHAETKIITSTGAVTERNYILRKTGAKAAVAHCIAAVFVDTMLGDKPRHLEMMPDADCIFDTTGVYSSNGDFRELRRGDVAAFQPGDIHAEKAEEINLSDVCNLLEIFQPDCVLIHDLLDFSSRNHHNVKDPFFLRRQFEEGNTVEGDLRRMTRVLDQLVTAFDGETHVIESNHDLAIDTWLRNTDWRLDPINSEIYLQLALAKIKGGNDHNSLAYAYAAHEIGYGDNPERITFHKTDEPLSIAGVDMSNHGHNGANGSRGSPKQFASLGVPMNTGHTHSPSIYGRVYTAGVTGSLEMGYNIGASSWMIAHILTFANGQRQILFGE